MLLQLVERLPLLLDHVAVREGEVVHALDRLQPLVVLFSLRFLVLEDLVSHDKSVCLVSLILVFVLELLAH